MKPPKPLTLIVLDGWGYSENTEGNAIAAATTPNWDRLWQTGAHALLDTSGEAVGLPVGQMGNSEVGHMNIGAGRTVYQDFSRIGQAILSGEFNNNPQLCNAIDSTVRERGTVHIMGLLSPGGVHSHEDHLYATVALAASRNAGAIRVHAFLDGRDTPPRSARQSIQRLEQQLADLDDAAIGTICGRYYAMDRDQRWERVASAWQALVHAEAGFHSASGRVALRQAYERGEDDEFVQPTIIGEYAGINDGDAVLFVNFRADRARQISRVFVEEKFTGFDRGRPPRLTAFVGFTEYLEGLPAAVAFPGETLTGILPEILAAHDLRQLRIAETEKYAHVTFFFNGGREQPYPGEERQLIPSPKVATYDLKPEMSAPELTRALVTAISSGDFDVIICNVANADMVGHSGNMAAAIKAVEAVDDLLGQVSDALQKQGGEMFITADHGNIEQMSDPATEQAHTAHTTNPVPLIYWGRPGTLAPGGSLRDLAPTMLHVLGIEPSAEMTGRNLLQLAAAHSSPD